MRQLPPIISEPHLNLKLWFQAIPLAGQTNTFQINCDDIATHQVIQHFTRFRLQAVKVYTACYMSSQATIYGDQQDRNVVAAWNTDLVITIFGQFTALRQGNQTGLLPVVDKRTLKNGQGGVRACCRYHYSAVDAGAAHYYSDWIGNTSSVVIGTYEANTPGEVTSDSYICFSAEVWGWRVADVGEVARTPKANGPLAHNIGVVVPHSTVTGKVISTSESACQTEDTMETASGADVQTVTDLLEGFCLIPSVPDQKKEGGVLGTSPQQCVQ